MTRQQALISLNMCPGIGSMRFNKLLGAFREPENIFCASLEQLMGVANIGPVIAQGIRCFEEKNLAAEIMRAKKAGVAIITMDDGLYPEQLKNIPDPPLVLYVKGELKPEDKNSIALVGSRRASFYGLTQAEKFARDLSYGGFTIVSGMARGIDSAAHRGALKNNGRTIAVMGSGFDYIYPEENRGLADEIVKHGAVISEFPMRTQPAKQHFPCRNRIISGLSLGVLVVEAARNSGALITADCALEQGREVFALPGQVDCNTSFGANTLIKQGAKLVSCVDDIIEEFVPPAPAAREKNNFSCQEDALYNAIADAPVQLDEIVEQTNMDVTCLMQVLLSLQLKQRIRQLPGKQFVRNLNEREEFSHR